MIHRVTTIDARDRAERGRGRSVLVVGTDEWVISQAADQLTDEGFNVLRCHDPGAPAFPCNALREGGVCPLDVGFDVVVTMRGRPVSPPTGLEFGAICAVHAGAPLVVGGLVQQNPFEEWAAQIVDVTDDLATSVEKAISQRQGVPTA